MMAIRWAQLVVAQWFIKEEKFIEETEPMD
jgi:hypothetical protein